MVRKGLRLGASSTGSGGAMMASHSISIQRFARSGGVVSISATTPVQLGELIRLLADGSPIAFGRSAYFEVSFEGVPTFTGYADINGSGNAWLDISAPVEEGIYVVRVRYPDTFFGSHWAATTFQVSDHALPPPDKPDSPGRKIFGDVKGILILGAVLVGLVVVAPILAKIGGRIVGK